LVVEQLLGIEIDQFTLIDFDGMAGVVDAIGGVTVTTEHELTYEGVTVPAGTSTINGDQALVFARFRDDAEGDFGRQQRQQELIQAILSQANPIDAARVFPTVLTGLEGHLKTDLRAGGVASVGFGFLRGCASSGIENAGLDGAVGNDWDDLEGMELSFVNVTDSEIASKVDWLVNGQSAWQIPHVIARTDERRGHIA
jgi:anionic cell wall polymer biosynthesis LytR-Cps2A-Psr (LCP) family protein